MILFLDSNIVIYAVEKATGLWSEGSRATGQRQDWCQHVHGQRPDSDGKPGRALEVRRQGPSVSFSSLFRLGRGQVVSITAAVCDRAALIRAATSFKQMDALQLAAAVEHGAASLPLIAG